METSEIDLLLRRSFGNNSPSMRQAIEAALETLTVNESTALLVRYDGVSIERVHGDAQRVADRALRKLARPARQGLLDALGLD